jgi:3-hydroxyisobutyrate dehydrogenase-like beta-hydroxyacid dehydrogenase
VAALTEFADAQVNTMPGQPVGSGYGLGTVGQPISKAAPQAGHAVKLPANTAMRRSYDPNRPLDSLNGTSLSREQVIAPVTTPASNLSVLSKVKAVLGFEKPAAPVPHTTYFPSLSRRNRERNEAKQWRRD